MRVLFMFRPYIICSIVLLCTFGTRAAADEADNAAVEIAETHRIQEVRGWEVRINRALPDDDANEMAAFLHLLDVQLERVEVLMPQKAVERLKEVPLWVNPPPPGERPTAAYHPSKGWLQSNDRDPRMAKCIEITSWDRLTFENNRMPALMMHELAHAWHDQVVPGGFGNPDIRRAWEAAKASGRYDTVLRWNGRRLVKDKAYALSSPMEYFAESTEALFCGNDFFPFQGGQLQSADEDFARVVRTMWGSP